MSNRKHLKTRAQKRKQEQMIRQLIKLGAMVVVVIIIIVLIVTGVHRGKIRKAEKEAQRIAQEQEQARLEAEEAERLALEKDVVIGSTGCMLLHGPILESRNYHLGEGEYDFTDIFKYVTPYYSEPDYMTCEFEGVLYGHQYQGYPTFYSPDVIATNVADAGVDMQWLATNHMYDGLSEGLHRTMDKYDELGLTYTGIRQSTSDKPYQVVQIKDFKIGFIDYTYETESSGVRLNENRLDDEDEDLVNTFDYEELNAFYEELEENISDMKADGAQFIILGMHWGQEYRLEESETQDKMAQKICDLGVDALIGGHPHCEQPIDVLESSDGERNMFCIYSVGNALSNQVRSLITSLPEGHSEDGVVVYLRLHQNPGEENVSITGVELVPTWVYRETGDNNTYYILPTDDPKGLEEKMGIPGIAEEIQASYDRSMGVLGEGLAKAKRVFGDETCLDL